MRTNSIEIKDRQKNRNPIKFDNRNLGFTLIGEGQHHADHAVGDNSSVKGKCTRLQYTGPGFGLQLTSRGFYIAHIGLIDCGLKVNSTRGFGTGMSRIENVDFYGKGIELGTSKINANAADIVISQCNFYDCDIAFESLISQCVHVRFICCEFNDCKVHTKVTAGGLFSYWGCNVIGGGDSLYLPKGATGRYVGSQNGIFRLDNHSWDQADTFPTRLLVDNSSSGRGRKLIMNSPVFCGRHVTKHRINRTKMVKIASDRTTRQRWEIRANDISGMNNDDLLQDPRAKVVSDYSRQRELDELSMRITKLEAAMAGTLIPPTGELD